MAKITFTNILTGFRTALGLNNNFQDIAVQLNDLVLYRDNPGGEPNEMKTLLDMNSKQIINLPVPVNGSEPVRFDQLTAFVAGGAIPAQEEGVTVVQIPTALNFIGPLITVTDVAGVATMTLISDAFTTLTDTPTSYSGEANKIVVVNGAETGLEFTAAAANTFTGHTDTPSSFSGEAGKVVVVNSGENALEFVTDPSAFEGVAVKLTGNVAITGGVPKIIDWPAEDFDTSVFHDNVTNNARLTIPLNLDITKVELTVNGDFGTPNSGALQLKIRKNGVDIIAGASTSAFSGSEFLSASTGPITVIDTDFFDVEVFSASTAQLDNTLATNFSLKVLSS